MDRITQKNKAVSRMRFNLNVSRGLRLVGLITFTITLVLITAIVTSSEVSFAEQIEIVTEELPPFQIVENGIIKGPTTEIVKAAAAKADLSYTINVYPWARAYRMALYNRNVCIYSIIRLNSREKNFQWAGNLAKVTYRFYKLASRKDIVVNSLEDAKKYNTAVVRDDVTHHLLVTRGFHENKNFYVTNDYINPFQLLFAGGGITLLINDDITLVYRTKQAKVDQRKLEQLCRIPELQAQMNVAFSLKTPVETVERFSAALAHMKEDGTFEKIWDEWRSNINTQ